MTKGIQDRVRDAFSEDDRENTLKFFEWCRSAVQDYESSLRRTATGILLLAALFELVANSRNVNVTISSFRVTKGSVILDILPALVAFLFLQSVIDAIKADHVVKASWIAAYLWSEKFSTNDLDTLIHGPSPLYWSSNFLGSTRDENTYRSDKVHLVAGLTFLLVLWLAVIVFEAHAYYVLFPSSLALWSVSLFFTIGCLALSVATLIATGMDSEATRITFETTVKRRS
jgi:hypothetical protein